VIIYTWVRWRELTTQFLRSVITPKKDNHCRGDTNGNKNCKHPISPPPTVPAPIRINALGDRSSEETIDDIRSGNSSLDSSSPLERRDIGDNDSIH
jgi:hypothetical protein